MIATPINENVQCSLHRQTRRTLLTMKDQGYVDPTLRLLWPMSRESLGISSSSVRELVAESSVVS